MKKTKLPSILFILVSLNLLNLLDAYHTYAGVTEGYLIELNPLMDYLLRLGPFYFFACKIALVGLGSTFLYLRRGHKLARLVVWFGFIIYFLFSSRIWTNTYIYLSLCRSPTIFSLAQKQRLSFHKFHIIIIIIVCNNNF